MKVNVEKHWLKEGKTRFYERKKLSVFDRKMFEKQQNVLLGYLENLDFHTIFEVGCGYGRITKLILDGFPQVREIKAIDISPQQIKIASKYVHDNRAKFKVMRIQDVQVGRGRYDLVLAVSVLMHIPFELVESALEKMVSVSRKDIINIDWYRPIRAMARLGTSFVHDYTYLYGKLGVEKIVRIPIPRRRVYGITLGLDSGIRVVRENQDIQCLWHAIK